ncbi:MAG: hypothetical protein U1D41_14570 [Nitrosomonas sp.]|uniref:hypothetical protein n=1 Tax=Nitrosomonas sp. TaxID=42353 RepID=UPI00274D9801|nr:hypothetical protein [Nitrosomonas sp.]MDP3609449.1 hypothetical protein [Methylophilus sp.]MDZ4107351.1 hypothetical protein [Nitrosomonas sp.]
MMRTGTCWDISVNFPKQHKDFRKTKLGIALGVADKTQHFSSGILKNLPQHGVANCKRNRNVAATHKPMPVFNVAALRIFSGE